MSLRAKLVLALSSVIALFILLDGAAHRLIVTSSFARLERESAEATFRGAVDAFHLELETLEEQGLVLASSFGAGEGQEVEALWRGAGAEGLDLFFLCEPDGRVRWSRVRGPADMGLIRLRDFPEEFLAPSNPLLAAPGRLTGIHMTEHGPLLIGAGPAGTNARAGSRILFGRFLDEDALGGICARASTRIHVAALEPGVGGLSEETLGEVVLTGGPVVVDSDEVRVRAFGTLLDLREMPALLVWIDEPKEITSAGANAIRSARFSTIFGSVLIVFVLLILIQRIVVRPLSKLRDHAIDIGRSEDTARRVGMQRADEIGQLAAEFDRMLAKLEESQRESIEVARHDGMSQIATGVLHNLGNVMNTVNVTAKQMGRNLVRWKVQDLEVVLRELREHRGQLDTYMAEDPRGRHLLDFLEAYLKDVAQRKADLLLAVDELGEGLAEVLSMIGAQEEFSGHAGLEEWVDVERILRETLEIVRRSSSDSGQLEASFEVSEVPRIKVDAHRLREILTNLMFNACESLEAQGGGQLVVRASLVEDRLHVELEDDGLGFESTEAARLFQYGVTTKTGGIGAGLHFAGNAATEMGGTLRGTSEGPGRGAKFTLEVPVRSTSCALKAA